MANHVVVPRARALCEPCHVVRRPQSFNSCCRVAPSGFTWHQQKGHKIRRIIGICAATKQNFGSFEELIQRKDKLVLVDFYAVWCGPCHLMGDILTKVAPSLGENIVFAKIDTDKYPALASQHRIEALPTLVLFKHGHAVDRIEGVLSADALRARLLKHVDAP